MYASGIEGYAILVTCSSSCPVMFNKLWGGILFSFGFFVPSCAMIGIYAKIFETSRKHLKRKPENSHQEKQSRLSKSKDRKAARTLSIIMGVFLLCWFPCFITILIDPFIGFSTPVVFFDALTWLGYFNSTCNPLIYGFFLPIVSKSIQIHPLRKDIPQKFLYCQSVS